MREKRRKFTPEFKAEAVRLVIDTSRPIAEVAREIGVHEGTLGNWVNQYRAEHAGDEPPLTPAGAGAAAGTRAGEPRVADEDGVPGKGGRATPDNTPPQVGARDHASSRRRPPSTPDR